MTIQPPLTKILFSCYAPVHFVCFRPIFERLRSLPNVSIHLSGGLREKKNGVYQYDTDGLFSQFGIDQDHVLSVDDIAERDFDVQFSANSKPIPPKSVGRLIQLFHGISYRNRAVRSAAMTFDHYFLVGPYMEKRFIDAGLLTPDDPRAFRIGFPKTDRLLNGELDRRQLMEAHGFDGSRPVLLYAPTGQPYNSMETMGEDVIERIQASDRYDLLIKLHDHPKNGINWTRRLKGLENDHCRVAADTDVVPLLYLADLLISDASSVTNEYSLLDRPIIFLDTPKLLAAEEATSGSMLDIDRGRWIGLTVHHPQNVPDAIAQQLGSPGMFSKLRRERAAEMFYNPGRAADAAMHWLDREIFDVDSVHPAATKVA